MALTVAKPLGIEAIDEQFIALGTKDYDLIIDITGNPDTAEATGHMEGFSQDWDAANAQLHIKAEDVTRLIAGVFWTVKLTKGSEVLTADIAYNVVKAAPIFETLSLLHLYRDVPINIDILIQNIPDLIVPNARLLGLKSELQEYGLNVKGKLPEDANFSKNEGDISMIVPSETGGTSEMHDYAYKIESGSPPAIVNPSWQPKGNYGAVSFADVNHALGYEWRLGDSDTAEWNFFNSARQVIDPSTIAVTPGNLNVTLTFPNIAGASSYAYMLESETHNVNWTQFVGTFENNMITTIIPNLEEGVVYTLWLRVASPWVGTPVSIQITGGRIAYALHEDTSVNDDHVLYVFHTGTVQGAVASTIKRILIPDDVNRPRDLAIDFKNGDFYILDDSTSIHVFPLNTDHDVEAVRSRKFSKPSTLNSPYTLAFYDGTLYSSHFTIPSDLESFLANTANGQTAVRINEYDVNRTGSIQQVTARTQAADADADSLYFTNNYRGNYIIRIPRVPLDYTDVDVVLDRRQYRMGRAGLSVIGNTAYTAETQDIYVADLTKGYSSRNATEQLLKSFIAPPGCTKIVGLVVAR